jgi:hypothetical protein
VEPGGLLHRRAHFLLVFFWLKCHPMLDASGCRRWSQSTRQKLLVRVARSRGRVARTDRLAAGFAPGDRPHGVAARSVLKHYRAATCVCDAAIAPLHEPDQHRLKVQFALRFAQEAWAAADAQEAQLGLVDVAQELAAMIIAQDSSISRSISSIMGATT